MAFSLEQKFWDTPVVFYWEWYWGKIQNWTYEWEEDFMLFDVKINDVFLERDNVIDIANSLWINYVPALLEWNIQSWIDYLQVWELTEWLVWVPRWNFLDRKWKRIIIKIKNRDFLNK